MSVHDRHLLRKRTIIGTMIDELKNIVQVEYSIYWCFDNFIVNLLDAITAYFISPKTLCANIKRTFDSHIALF